MGALPLTLVHVGLDFADLPEPHAKAEVHVVSGVLRPVGYMPLTGKHNTDGISTVSWLWHRHKGSILRKHPCPQWEDRNAQSECMDYPQHRKDQELLSALLQVVCAACIPNRELPFPMSWAFNSILGLHCKLKSWQRKKTGLEIRWYNPPFKEDWHLLTLSFQQIWNKVDVQLVLWPCSSL